MLCKGTGYVGRQDMTALIDARRADNPSDSFYYSRVSRRHKYLWVAVAKVASVTTAITLRELDGNPFSGGALWDDDPSPKLKDCTTPEIVEMLTSQEWFRFGFVRNPYDRLFSAYKSKIGNAGAEEWYLDVQREIREVNDYPTRNGELVGMVSFRDFVRYVQSGVRAGDGHWCVQAKRLMMDMIPYDFIGRFERYGEDFRTVLQRLNAPANVLQTASQVRGQTVKICLAAAYDRELADAVHEIYREDFETFGYDRDSWMFDYE